MRLLLDPRDISCNKFPISKSWLSTVTHIGQASPPSVVLPNRQENIAIVRSKRVSDVFRSRPNVEVLKTFVNISSMISKVKLL